MIYILESSKRGFKIAILNVKCYSGKKKLKKSFSGKSLKHGKIDKKFQHQMELYNEIEMLREKKGKALLLH